MSLSIQTNLYSLSAMRSLHGTESARLTALQRLGSGVRINSARDDAAGLAIANRFTTQVNGLSQGVRNIADGVSLAQSAEGGLESITTNLQRIRELAVQSANFTNTTSDRAALQEEVSQLQREITRVAEQTRFSGVRLLDGSFASASFQAGANVGETISVGQILDARAESLGMTQAVVSTTQNVSASNTNANQRVQIAGGPVKNLGFFNRDARLLANAINAAGISGLSASANVNIRLGSAATGTPSTGTYQFVLNGKAFSVVGDVDADSARDNMVAAINAIVVDTGVTAAVESPGSGVRLTAADGRNITLAEITGVGSAEYFGLGGLVSSAGLGSSINVSYQTPPMTFGAMVFSDTGMATESFALPLWTPVANIDLKTVEGSNLAIQSIDLALQAVGAGRARLGAAMNRFEAAIGAQRITHEGQSASRSRILDTDMAQQSAALARAQILQQSGMAILSQANAVPQNVLSLLA